MKTMDKDKFHAMCIREKLAYEIQIDGVTTGQGFPVLRDGSENKCIHLKGHFRLGGNREDPFIVEAITDLGELALELYASEITVTP